MISNFFYTFDIRNLLLKHGLTCKNKNATVELLKSSISVSISGIFRLYLVSLLLQTHISKITCIAGGLIIYSVYILDRSLDSEEDIVNRKELSGSRKEIGLAVSALTFMIGSYVLAKEGLLAIAFLPLVTGFLYSKGIKIGRFALKLKGGLGVKNLVVGLTWGIFIVGVSVAACKNLIAIILVFILVSVKTFVNSVIDDFKDVEGDTLAGLKTLPVYLGDRKTRNFLLGMHFTAHLILGFALLTGIIAFEPVIIACSFICGFICIWNYTNEKKYMSGKQGLMIFKDGESALIFLAVQHFNSGF